MPFRAFGVCISLYLIDLIPGPIAIRLGDGARREARRPPIIDGRERPAARQR
jgi:hypothetical protein